MKKKKKLDWGYLLLIPGLGYICFFVIVSAYVMISQSLGMYNAITGEVAFTLDSWRKVLDKSFFDSLWFTLKVSVSVSFISIAITYPLALLLQKSKARKWLLPLIKIPYFIPGLVGSFLIVNLIDYHGLMNEILILLRIIKEPLRLRNDDNGIAVIIIHIWKNVPFMMIIMFSAIEGVRQDIKDCARNLGANSLKVLWHITLPLTVSSALVAVILTFIRTFNDYAISSTAGPMYPLSLSNLMKTTAYTYDDWATAGCIGVLMTVVTVIFMVLYTVLGRYLKQGGGKNG